MQQQIGFIGLGQMGAPMALRVLAPDIALHVYDPAEAAIGCLVEAGAIRHASPASVAAAADLVFACLPSPAVSEAAALGPQGIGEGGRVRVYVEMSTIGRAAIERIAAGLAARGISRRRAQSRCSAARSVNRFTTMARAPAPLPLPMASRSRPAVAMRSAGR